ncbi:MAG: Uncharacterized protein K0R14_470 [Burkholderiales bacterium]|jgi:tRNA-dependent cyclodipeptide synthase|nr:Uncharacterized protein [Burkholderiales bacterium]
MSGKRKIKRAILRCLPEYKPEFKNAKCSVAISVGQPVHEGEKFEAVLTTVNSSFRECTIIVGDSLQRHTLKMDKSISNAHEQANQLGLEWLKRNEQAINKLTIKFDIIRWDYWLSHPGYKDARKQIDELFLYDKNFKASVEISTKSFLERNTDKLTTITDYSEIVNDSYEYLKEECAVMIIWQNYDYQFEVYAGSRNAALRYVHENIISKTAPHLVREVKVKFRN